MSTPSYDEVVKNLTGSGALFEVVHETIAGREQKVFKSRERSLSRFFHPS